MFDPYYAHVWAYWADVARTIAALLGFVGLYYIFVCRRIWRKRDDDHEGTD